MNDELYHFGVKGMKWGQRKAKVSSSRQASFEKRFAKAPDPRMKRISDTELRNMNNRLQMEQQYKTLNQSKAAAGKKFAMGLGKAAVSSIVVGTATAVGQNYVKRALRNKGINI